MASSVSVVLDTTPPDIRIVGVNHAQQGVDYDFTILSSEPIDTDIQDVRITDINGYSEPVECEISADGRTLAGKTKFNRFAPGMATISAVLCDEVWNQSEECRFTVYISKTIAVCRMTMFKALSAVEVLYALNGDTLQATAQFQDKNGGLVEVTDAEVYIYNSNRMKIATVIPDYMSDTASYAALYTFYEEGDYYVEFHAKFNGSPVLNREKVIVRFATR